MSADLAARLQAALGDAYRIERELGGGGMSRLFVAEEASLRRQVVIKVLPPQFASEVSAARFRQEIELAARLQHPNILPVLNAGTRDDLLYYVIPYVPGESLRHRLTREGKLPLQDAIELLREMADAVAHAHLLGIIHRDIKPENVLLMGRHASLTDFGVARALVEARTGQRLTETGLAVGTPGYMAPEQAAADRHVDARADVYALAVVGYEMLAGKPPFEGPTAQAVLAAHLTSAPKPLATVRSEVPAEVSAVIARALAKAPEDRYQSAAEFRDALKPVVQVPESRRRRRLLLAGAAVGVAVIAGAATLIGRSRTAQPIDQNLLAIAPFEAISGSVEEYREGLVTILSRSLDGAGPIRTVSPTIVVRRWTGRADPTSASALGKATGAGLVVFGQVVPAGQDSVRLSATIFDVRRGRSAGDVEVRDERQRIDRIADSLAVRVLREVGRGRPVGVVRFAALGSTSLPAIKLFLQAEQFYRRGQWDSTLAYARQAVAEDSNFTLALRRIPNALWWGSGVDVNPLLLRAGAHNHGLAPRESLQVVVDSLWAAVSVGQAGRWPLLRRMNAAVREAVDRYPDDPEGWYRLGELAFHFGASVSPRYARRQAFDAFARALQLDSVFAPAYEHIVDLSLREGEPELARRYGEAYLRLQPDGATALRTALDLLENPAAPPSEARAFLDTAGTKSLFELTLHLRDAIDSGEAGVVAARAYDRSMHGSTPSASRRQASLLPMVLAYRGHLQEAKRLVWERGVLDFNSQRLASDLIWLGAVAPDSADRWMSSHLDQGSLFAYQGLSWLAARGDTASLHRLRELARSTLRSIVPGTTTEEYWTYAEAATIPFLALARGDTAAALAEFATLPDSLCQFCSQERLTRMVLLTRQGRDAEAATLLQDPLQNATGPMDVFWTLHRGRVNERLGRRQPAVEAYRFVVAAWRNADPELQPLVEEAKQGLARLTSEK